MISERCTACTGKYCVIMGDGPKPCSVMMIGQNPGKTEEAQAARGEVPRVFVGAAGLELWKTYTPLAGITRSNVYTTNVMKCHTDNDRKPSPKEVAACSSLHLKREIEECDPEIIVLMGATALSIVPELDITTHHGYPFQVDIFGGKRWVFPINHPAAGLHDAKVMVPLLEDFERLYYVLRGQIEMPVDEYPDPHYEDLTGRHHDLVTILQAGLAGEREMARDTETLSAPGERPVLPWCSTFTINPGTGYMLRFVDKEGFHILARYVPEYLAITHNFLFDGDVEEAMGLGGYQYVDTMQVAFQQGNLPLGLKPLAWRLCGMEMEDYSDIVLPYSRQSVLEWLEQAFDIASQMKVCKIVPKKYKLGAKSNLQSKLAQIRKRYGDVPIVGISDSEIEFHLTEMIESPLSKKILHLFNHTAKQTAYGSTPYNPWKAWVEQVDQKDEQVCDIVSKIGPLPRASIEEVFKREPSKALRYACRDSDSTRRIFPKLVERAARYAGKVMMNDIDR